MTRETISRIEVSNPPGVLSVMMRASVVALGARDGRRDDLRARRRDLIVKLEVEDVRLAPVLAANINNQSAAAVIVLWPHAFYDIAPAHKV